MLNENQKNKLTNCMYFYYMQKVSEATEADRCWMICLLQLFAQTDRCWTT